MGNYSVITLRYRTLLIPSSIVPMCFVFHCSIATIMDLIRCIVVCYIVVSLYGVLLYVVLLYVVSLCVVSLYCYELYRCMLYHCMLYRCMLYRSCSRESYTTHLSWSHNTLQTKLVLQLYYLYVELLSWSGPFYHKKFQYTNTSLSFLLPMIYFPSYNTMSAWIGPLSVRLG